jgi:hypothetical protein
MLNGPERHLQGIPFCTILYQYGIHCSQQHVELLQSRPFLRSQSLNKYEKIEINPHMLSDDNTIKLDFNNRRKSRKYLNT